MIMPIVKFPSPILNLKSEEVTDFGPSLQNLINSMIDTASTFGVGISAIQIGIPKQVMLISEDAKDFTVIINPKINWYSKDVEAMLEGCLSLDDKQVWVTRPKEVEVTFNDPTGALHTERFTGLLARVALHEMQHFQGEGIWLENNYHYRYLSL